MTKSKTKNILTASLLLLSLTFSVNAGLPAKINEIINRPSQKKVNFSVTILKADSAETVFTHKSNQPLIPASNMKLITSAAALKYLGPNYKYKTTVLFGPSENTLIVKGSGDPLLGDRATDAKYNRPQNSFFKEIISALKSRKITEINDIVIDTSVFDDQRVHPSWPRSQLNRPYACEVSGVNYNGNCIEITVTNIAGRIKLSVSPQTDFVKLTNKVTPVRSGKRGVGAYRQAGKPNQLLVKGRCKKKQGPFAVAIERGGAFFGFLLYEHLAKAGINVKGQLIERSTRVRHDFIEIAAYQTPIADCLWRCNKNSFALAAEAMLKTISANANPQNKNGSWPGGRRLIEKYLTDLGIDTGEFNIDDGSGLSRKNKLTTNAITKVLSDVYHSRNWPLFKDSLAIGGIDGTLKKHFKEKKYKGRIHAKTGYISGVKSLSGVCTTDNGDYIFSIITNKTNAKTRKAINDIAKAITQNK